MLMMNALNKFVMHIQNMIELKTVRKQGKFLVYHGIQILKYQKEMNHLYYIKNITTRKKINIIQIM